MAISMKEVQILILESALESSREHEYRCQRRLDQAREAVDDATASTRALRTQIARLRDQWLMESAT